jgi:two-component system OmpR family response regulator
LTRPTPIGIPWKVKFPRLLLIDDDVDLREVLAEFLRSLDFDVSEAQDGAGALARVLAGALDVIVLDWQLPGEPAGAQLLRELLQCAGMPVMVISADRPALEEASVAGAHAIMAKPFDLDHFAAMILALVKLPPTD